MLTKLAIRVSLHARHQAGWVENNSFAPSISTLTTDYNNNIAASTNVRVSLPGPDVCHCVNPTCATTWIRSVPLPEFDVCHCLDPTCATAWIRRVPLPESDVCHCLNPTCTTAWIRRVPLHELDVCHCLYPTCATAWTRRVPLPEPDVCHCLNPTCATARTRRMPLPKPDHWINSCIYQIVGGPVSWMNGPTPAITNTRHTTIKSLGCPQQTIILTK